MIESVHVKFDETTNIGAKKCHSIVGDGVENINTTNENQATIIENVQETPTTQDVLTNHGWRIYYQYNSSRNARCFNHSRKRKSSCV
jgi:hypothetical protein